MKLLVPGSRTPVVDVYGLSSQGQLTESGIVLPVVGCFLAKRSPSLMTRKIR
jgi:hypothetical protein